MEWSKKWSIELFLIVFISESAHPIVGHPLKYWNGLVGLDWDSAEFLLVCMSFGTTNSLRKLFPRKHITEFGFLGCEKNWLWHPDPISILKKRLDLIEIQSKIWYNSVRSQGWCDYLDVFISQFILSKSKWSSEKFVWHYERNIIEKHDSRWQTIDENSQSYCRNTFEFEINMILQIYWNCFNFCPNSTAKALRNVNSMNALMTALKEILLISEIFTIFIWWK
jgi:hypothetical protein